MSAISLSDSDSESDNELPKCAHLKHYMPEKNLKDLDINDTDLGYYGYCIYCILLDPNYIYHGEEWDSLDEVFGRCLDLYEKGYNDYLAGVVLRGDNDGEMGTVEKLKPKGWDNYILRTYLRGYNLAKKSYPFLKRTIVTCKEISHVHYSDLGNDPN